MDRDTVIAKLQEHQAELQALGVAHASVFGSTARGDNTPASDIDVAVKLDPARALYGLDGFGRLMEIEARLETILQKPVDVVAEPARKERLQAEIEKDRAVAF
ncbi:MAG: nucleotidyltransferase family protein [Rhodomicrobium sp.]